MMTVEITSKYCRVVLERCDHLLPKNQTQEIKEENNHSVVQSMQPNPQNRRELRLVLERCDHLVFNNKNQKFKNEKHERPNESLESDLFNEEIPSIKLEKVDDSISILGVVQSMQPKPQNRRELRLVLERCDHLVFNNKNQKFKNEKHERPNESLESVLFNEEIPSIKREKFDDSISILHADTPIFQSISGTSVEFKMETIDDEIENQIKIYQQNLNESVLKQEKNDKTLYICNTPKENFNRFHFNSYMAFHRAFKNRTCFKCYKKFLIVGNLKNHLISHHRDNYRLILNLGKNIYFRDIYSTVNNSRKIFSKTQIRQDTKNHKSKNKIKMTEYNCNTMNLYDVASDKQTIVNVNELTGSNNVGLIEESYFASTVYSNQCGGDSDKTNLYYNHSSIDTVSLNVSVGKPNSVYRIDTESRQSISLKSNIVSSNNSVFSNNFVHYKLYKCAKCYSVFYNRSSLKNHLKLNTDLCVICCKFIGYEDVRKFPFDTVLDEYTYFQCKDLMKFSPTFIENQTIPSKNKPSEFCGDCIKCNMCLKQFNKI